MPVLREQDFDKLANRIVDRFLSGEAKLAEAAAEEATAHGMNPDQIDRLAQTANTQTFLRMMDERKTAGAEDLMHEFDPIDARHVIRLVIDNAGVHVMPQDDGMGGMPDAPHGYGDSMPGEMPPPADEMEIPDEMGDAKGFPPAPFKSKKKKDDSDDDKDDDKDDKKKSSKTASAHDSEVALRRMRKMANVLEGQFLQAEMQFDDTMSNLVSRFKRAHTETSYESFEKDAMAEFGTPVGVGVLNMIRAHRRVESLDPATVIAKVAHLADRHISDETPELHLFENLVKLATEAQRLQRGLELVRAQCS